VHELYRIVFNQRQAMLEKEERERKEKEEAEKRALEEEREKRSGNMPMTYAVNHSRVTPPSKQDHSSAADNITVSDLEDFLEEVTS